MIINNVFLFSKVRNLDNTMEQMALKMGRVTDREKEILNQLVVDCNMYNFSERDSLEYIKRRFGKQISGRTYRRYKSELESGNLTQNWMNYFTRTGFVVQHQQLLFAAKNLLQFSMRSMLQEESKENQDTDLILDLMQSIRENIKLVNELMIGTPVIAKIKERIQKLEERLSTKDAEIE